MQLCLFIFSAKIFFVTFNSKNFDAMFEGQERHKVKEVDSTQRRLPGEPWGLTGSEASEKDDSFPKYSYLIDEALVLI